MEIRPGTPSADDLVTHSSFVRWLAFDLVGNADEAEEVAQETLVRAIERPCPVSTSVTAWLAGVTRNVVRMRRRAAARRARRERSTVRCEALPSAAATAEGMEVLRRLTDAVAGLTEPYRTAVLLRYYEGLPPREIARRTGAPVKTVKTRLNRALAMLRSRLDESTGTRREWVALLLPFCPRPRILLPVVPGAILMTWKTKVAVSVVALTLFAALVALRAGGRTPSPGPEAGPSCVASESASALLPEESPVTSNPPARIAVAPRAPVGPHGTVRVRIVDATTGEPLPGVAVHRCRLDAPGSFFGGDEQARAGWISNALSSAAPSGEPVTDAQGRVVLHPSPGPYVLLVRHPRYHDYVGPRFPVRADGERDFEFPLVPFPEGEREIVLTGRVTDGATTAPLCEVEVTATYGERSGRRALRTVTDPAGVYSLTVPANCLVEIHFARGGYEDFPLTLAVDPRRRPASRGDVSLLRVDGRPRRGEGQIVGWVLDATTEEPVRGALVTLERHVGGPEGRRVGGSGPDSGSGGIVVGRIRRKTADGRFRFDLPPAGGTDERVHLVVRREGYEKYTSDALPLRADHTTEVVARLVPRPSETVVSGCVVDAATDRPVAGARVVAEDVFRRPVASTTTDPEGRFSLPSRSEAARLRVTAEGYGEADEQPGAEVRLALFRNDAVLCGTIVDERSRRPLAGAVVTTYLAPDGLATRSMTVTDPHGRYLLPVPAGEYLVRAVLEGRGPAVSLPVTAVSGETETVDLAMVAADCVVRGEVRAATTGELLPEAAKRVRVIRWAADGDERARLESRLGACDGGIRVAVQGAGFSCELAPGRYLLALSTRTPLLGSDRALPVGRVIELAAGESRRVDLALEPVPPLDSTIRGVVRRSGTGGAVADAEIRVEVRGCVLGRTRTGPDGRFDLAAPRGECVVRCTGRIGERTVTREVTVSVPPGGSEVEIPVGP